MLLVHDCQTALLFIGCTAATATNRIENGSYFYCAFSLKAGWYDLNPNITLKYLYKDSLTLQVRGVTGQVSILSKERLNSWVNVCFLCRHTLRTMLIMALPYFFRPYYCMTLTKQHTKQMNGFWFLVFFFKETLDTLQPWHKKNLTSRHEEV